MFNVMKDPSEKKNLRAEHPDVAASPQGEYATCSKQFDDPNGRS